MYTKDRLTPAKRSENMSRIRGKNTSPELWVRSLLHRHGFRFRLHAKSLPGCPDIILPKFKYAIFVNGCFWHLHGRCKEGRLPKSNLRFWRRKLEGNKKRDTRNMRLIKRLGYRVMVIWTCEIERRPEKVVLRLIRIREP